MRLPSSLEIANYSKTDQRLFFPGVFLGQSHVVRFPWKPDKRVLNHPGDKAHLESTSGARICGGMYIKYVKNPPVFLRRGHWEKPLHRIGSRELEGGHRVRLLVYAASRRTIDGSALLGSCQSQTCPAMRGGNIT